MVFRSLRGQGQAISSTNQATLEFRLQSSCLRPEDSQGHEESQRVEVDHCCEGSSFRIRGLPCLGFSNYLLYFQQLIQSTLFCPLFSITHPELLAFSTPFLSRPFVFNNSSRPLSFPFIF